MSSGACDWPSLTTPRSSSEHIPPVREAERNLWTASAACGHVMDSLPDRSGRRSETQFRTGATCKVLSSMLAPTGAVASGILRHHLIWANETSRILLRR